jgi:hypothetical protein
MRVRACTVPLMDGLTASRQIAEIGRAAGRRPTPVVVRARPARMRALCAAACAVQLTANARHAFAGARRR